MVSAAPTKDLHTQIVNEILKPRWADNVAVAIKPKQIKDWLYTIMIEDTTGYKYKGVMGVVVRKNSSVTRKTQNRKVFRALARPRGNHLGVPN